MLRSLINAPLKFVTRAEEANNYSAVAKILYVGEDSNIPNFYIPVPILLPPIDIQYCEMTNSMDSYYQGYENYLNNNELVAEICNQILTLLLNGYPVVIYIQNGHELEIGNFLPKWFYLQYGLYNYETIYDYDEYGNMFYPYFDKKYNDKIACCLYTYANGSIGGKEFILNLQDFNWIDQLIMNRLISDFNINTTGKTVEDILNFFREYKDKYYRFYINPRNNNNNNTSPIKMIEDK